MTEEDCCDGIFLNDNNCEEIFNRDQNSQLESLKKMVPTRWNSICSMFRSISRNFKVIEELLVGTDLQQLIFTLQERKQIDQLLEF